MMRFILWILMTLLCLTLSGCFEWGYYRQAMTGQWRLLSQRQDIGALIADQRTPAALRERLELVQRIRDFAVTELQLPDNKSYRTYADLERPFAVWNLVATPAFSLEPQTWCFPVAGCVPYRGYFSRQDAERFAAHRQEQGEDVQVYGVAAYSTLNWFDDPVLSTFVHYQEPKLAGLIFHELAHQLVYVKNDGTFNESFAQTVEQIGVERWMKAGNQSLQLAAYQQRRMQHREFIALLLETRRQLSDFFAESEDLPPAQRQLGKDTIIDRFRENYRHWKQQQWQDSPRFDRWVERPLNNAHFALIATYFDYVPAFYQLLARHDQDLSRFYAAVKKLAQLSKEERQQQLERLLDASESQVTTLEKGAEPPF